MYYLSGCVIWLLTQDREAVFMESVRNALRQMRTSQEDDMSSHTDQVQHQSVFVTSDFLIHFIVHMSANSLFLLTHWPFKG